MLRSWMPWRTTSETDTGKFVHLREKTQNCRMFGFGRDLYGSSSPTPLLKQGHLQQAAQDLVQAGLENLQRRRIHNLPGQPVPVLRHPQSEEVLPHVQTQDLAKVCDFEKPLWSLQRLSRVVWLHQHYIKKTCLVNAHWSTHSCKGKNRASHLLLPALGETNWQSIPFSSHAVSQRVTTCYSSCLKCQRPARFAETCWPC